MVMMTLSFSTKVAAVQMILPQMMEGLLMQVKVVHRMETGRLKKSKKMLKVNRLNQQMRVRVKLLLKQMSNRKDRRKMMLRLGQS